jgi:DNA-binding response OmpR family regulator
MTSVNGTLLRPVARGSDSAILCVDDEPRVLSALERTFGREGYQVLRAADGGAALELIESAPIKVVVADQRMPGMTGSELLEEIRRRRPTVGRIILTGFPGREVMVRSLEAEVDFLLYKPWDDDKLRLAVRRLIREVDRARVNDPEVSGGSGWDLGGEGG